ncbi:MAG: phage tail tube protein [Oscillospiraceae bacterium]
MGYLHAKDIISGQEAVAFIKIGDIIEEMFYAKNLKAIAKKKKVLLKTLGRRGAQSKTSGFEGTGSMNIYSVTSLFKKLMSDYIKSGKDVYFDIQVTNNDPTSSVGQQTVLLKNCNIDSVVMANFDIYSESLDEQMSFTFDDVDILEMFNPPVF